MPECIGMEMLFSFQIFTRNYKIRRGIINFASQRNFKQTFVSEILLKKSNACFLCRFEYIQKHPFLMKVRTRHLKTKT